MVDLPHRGRIVAERTEVRCCDGARVIDDVVTLHQTAHRGNPAGDARVVADRHIARHIDQRIELSIAAVLDIQIADDHDDQVLRFPPFIDFGIVGDEQITLDVDTGRP
ncbi:hypothetical protein D3C78_1293710 [compost metagenome]